MKQCLFWNLCLSRCSFFAIILNFCIDRPFGFRPIRINIFFYVSNFCLDRPFGFSVHRDALFCLSHLFRFATYRAFVLLLFFCKFFVLTKYFLIASVFSGCTSLSPSFVFRHPFAPWIWLKRLYIRVQGLILGIRRDEPSLLETCFILLM